MVVVCCLCLREEKLQPTINQNELEITSNTIGEDIELEEYTASQNEINVEVVEVTNFYDRVMSMQKSVWDIYKNE